MWGPAGRMDQFAQGGLWQPFSSVAQAHLILVHLTLHTTSVLSSGAEALICLSLFTLTHLGACVARGLLALNRVCHRTCQ